MAGGRDYIPKMKAQFDEWLRNFSAEISAIATPLGITPALITAVTTAYANWQTTYTALQTAQNAAQSAVEINDEAGAVARDAVRAVAGMLQKHPGLTNGQRETLGITVPDKEPSPIPPDYVLNLAPPNLILDWKQRGYVTVHFGVNPANERLNAKPKDIAGAKIWFRIESGPWQEVAMDTNSPYLHNLNITEPQNVEYRAQWLDKKQRLGPFGEIAKCTVSP